MCDAFPTGRRSREKWHHFKPKVDVLGSVGSHWATSLFTHEPSLYHCTPGFALDNGGALHRRIISELSDKYIPDLMLSNWVIDSRVNMLMPGQYPSIPGWHCDGVPRGHGEDGQPLLNICDPCGEFVMVYLESGEDSNSRTEFLVTPHDIKYNPSRVWGSVDFHVNEACRYYKSAVQHVICNDVPQRRFIEMGEVVRFNQTTLHRATPAERPGWRMFFRAARNVGWEVRNEVRRQVQVYQDMTRVGW